MKSTNVHHIIGRQHRQNFRVYKDENKAVIEIARHNALHALFFPANTPHEQFEVINNLRLPIQSKIIKELVDEINNTPIKDWYKEGLVIK